MPPYVTTLIQQVKSSRDLYMLFPLQEDDDRQPDHTLRPIHKCASTLSRGRKPCRKKLHVPPLTTNTSPPTPLSRTT